MSTRDYATTAELRDQAQALLDVMSRQHGSAPFSHNVMVERDRLHDLLKRGRLPVELDPKDKADRR